MGYRFDQGVLKLSLESAFSQGGAAWAYWPLRGGRLNTGGLVQKYHPRDSMRAQNAPQPGIVGCKSDSTLSLPGWLHGWKLSGAVDALPVLADYNACIDARIMASALGAVWYHAALLEGTTIAGTTASLLKLGVGEAAAGGYVAGAAIVVDTSATATPKYEVGWVKVIAVDDLTLEAPLTAAPAIGKKVWGSITCHQPLNDFMVQALGATFQGHPADEYYAIKGIEATSLKMTYTPKDFLTLDLECAVNDWTRSAGAAPVPAALTGPDREPVINSVCRFAPVGGATTTLDCSAFEIDWALKTILVDDPNGTQGRKRSVIGLADPRIKVNPLYISEAWITAFEAGTQFSLSVQVGTAPGRIVAVGTPAAVLVQTVREVDRNGASAVALEFMPVEYAGDDVAGTYQRSGAATPTPPTDAILKVAFG